jgi:hypothetical protein
MFELQCFTSSIANTAADQQINILQDGRFLYSSNGLVIPSKYRNLLVTWAFGTNLTIAKLKPAAYRPYGDYSIMPIMNAAAAGDQVSPVVFLNGNPLILDVGDFLPAYGQQGSAGAQQAYVFCILGEAVPQQYKGPVYTVRGTGSTTLTANAWSNVTLTMDSTLPAGRFRCVGARARSAGALAFRLVFAEQFPRPGAMAYQSDLAALDRWHRRGALGVWGEFDHLQPPSVDFLSTSADTSEYVWLDLVKV